MRSTIGRSCSLVVWPGGPPKFASGSLHWRDLRDRREGVGYPYRLLIRTTHGPSYHDVSRLFIAQGVRRFDSCAAFLLHAGFLVVWWLLHGCVRLFCSCFSQ